MERHLNTDGAALVAREYEWIVKGGEELRIDQRMEQLLDVANGLLARNPSSASHRLQVQEKLNLQAVWSCGAHVT